MTENNVKSILEQMIDGIKNVINGCAELDALRLEGYDFSELYSHLQHYPLPKHYDKWDKDALDDKLKDLERLNNKVISLSLELLEEIK